MAFKSCSKYKAGMLTHIIQLDKRALSPKDRGGGAKKMWDPWQVDVFAGGGPLSSREQLHAAQLKNRITHEFFFRYVAGVKADMSMRIDIEGKTKRLNIRSVINVELRNRWIVITADENTPQ